MYIQVLLLLSMLFHVMPLHAQDDLSNDNRDHLLQQIRQYKEALLQQRQAEAAHREQVYKQVIDHILQAKAMQTKMAKKPARKNTLRFNKAMRPGTQ